MGAVTFSIDLRLVECLKESLPLNVFVETGTFKGETVESVHQFFRECVSVELSESLAKEARARLDGVPNARVEQGDSVEFLRRLLPRLRSESALFWLDAHWCASEGTAGETSQCPLLDELGAIGQLNEQSVILVDDARLFLCPPPAPHEVSQWPSFQTILDTLKTLSSHHCVMVVNDVIAFYPEAIAGTFADFAYRHGVDWLALAHSAGLERELRSTIEQLGQSNAQNFHAQLERLRREQAKKAELKTKLQKAKDKIEKLKAAPKQRRHWWQPRHADPAPPPPVQAASTKQPEPTRPVEQPTAPLPTTTELPPEADMVHVFKRMAAARKMDVIFDVGANEGQTMLNLVDAFPGARIYSFEPFPEALAKLQQNALRFPQVHTYQQAVGERDGTSTLFLSKASVVNSLLPTSAEAADYSPDGWTDAAGSVEVPITTLDTFCAKHHVDRIDLLKIDSQGYESKILDGASALLRDQRIGFIYLEVIFVPLYEGQSTFEEICSKLRQHGYHFMDLYEKNVHEDGKLQWCNALFSAPWAGLPTKITA